MNKDIIKALNWRYGVQEFDASKDLSANELEVMIESLRLAPSAFGLQPWKFIIVTNPAVRAELRAAAWDQVKVTDSPYLIVLAAQKTVDEAYVDRYAEYIAQVRGITVEALKGYIDMMKGFVKGKSAEDMKKWSARQVYIALGSLITSAAVAGIDVGPMEGFDPKKFDEILGLEKLGLESVVIAAVGHRSPSDKAAAYKKVRFSKEDLFIEVK